MKAPSGILASFAGLHDNLHGEVVHGRLGNDVLHATRVAYGGPGNDRCIAPVRVGCER
jgi:hypothetical protein